MLDPDLDAPMGYIDLCDLKGICPFCGGEQPDGCRCDEDLELEADAGAHPGGCLCCLPEELEDRFRTAPVVHLPARPPLAWSQAERVAMDRQLRAAGTTITELSDARELLGLPRLSDSTPAQRLEAPGLVRTPRGQRAIGAVREQRASLVEAIRSCARTAVHTACTRLGLRRIPSRLRLGELRALYAQTRIVELTAGG